METFDDLQRGLGPVLAMNRPGVDLPHVLVVMPSFSIGESLLCHYEDRIPALEHRFLLAILILQRIRSCEMIFLSGSAAEPEALDHYLSLCAPELREDISARFHSITVPGPRSRPIAAKLLARPEILDRIVELIAGRPAFIEPWNVTQHEVDVAMRLGVPINGTHPHLWPLGFKSACRRLFRTAGVPLPDGHEDVRSIDGVVAAIHDLRARRPASVGAVVKLDDSGAGDGNVVIRHEGADALGPLRARIAGLPGWYLKDLRNGAVVEELIVGERFTSPSVQVDITPDGAANVLSTHEQVLGGDAGQVYTGCRFPADPSYAPELATYGRMVGEELARQGVLGRIAVDFAVASNRTGRASINALEINLRKGGTTHPYSVLRNLVPGRYEADAGSWKADADGTPRWYRATDNLVDEAWLGVPPGDVIAAIDGAGITFDAASGSGVVLHMLSALAIDGRFGLTAIGRSSDEAEELYEKAAEAVPRRAVAVTASTR